MGTLAVTLDVIKGSSAFILNKKEYKEFVGYLDDLGANSGVLRYLARLMLKPNGLNYVVNGANCDSRLSKEGPSSLKGRVLISYTLNYAKPFFLENRKMQTFEDSPLICNTFGAHTREGYKEVANVYVVEDTVYNILNSFKGETTGRLAHFLLGIQVYPECFNNARGFSKFKQGDKICIATEGAGEEVTADDTTDPFRSTSPEVVSISKNVYKAVVAKVYEDKMRVDIYKEKAEDTITSTTVMHHRLAVPQEEIIFHVI